MTRADDTSNALHGLRHRVTGWPRSHMVRRPVSAAWSRWPAR